MMEAVRTSETSVDNHFTRQYNPEDNSEHPSSVLTFIVRAFKYSVYPISPINHMLRHNTRISVHIVTRHFSNIRFNIIL
jgi:hypothetical protein